MGYSIAPYLPALIAGQDGSSPGGLSADARAAARWFALVDVGQFVPPEKALRGGVTREALLQRLRFFMWVEADRTPYLLRLADMPSMRAVVAVLSSAQRQQLFAELSGWWCVDHAGRLVNLVELASAESEPALAPSETPQKQSRSGGFELDAGQTAGVMRGTEIPIFAAQIRHFEPSFAQRLSHARQSQFASDFLDEARLEAYEEGKLLELARARWQAIERDGDLDA